ncbi:hypothetical protein CLAFUW4_07991 [Fulvia fulva]|uniref:Uncharacterized protein n=1 Tax=Passalora fulva TaxID=5499 RepID=A0A9Q8LCM3_PASFU|nr:uncharacterized protein CLAFUR5_08112 [Fulvia fulva]KAK4629261.1 hypothetical protein CLAFUR4_07996 [Fulvia fulva]KAK4630345.1 hypothetical protein CLAFUR0_07992 [Fulvia fulva]UJO15066.1 hypothetical protein CLAFUR5_08112 [Fulvia fulva]WPV12628.1 hypothetical protein CLAFUW4_07991 [Fulvia fulva]WPV27466.1 hypothetical protein CLAFUW7_07991 [Fulvia fulva]
MQFKALTLLSLSALAIAAPVETSFEEANPLMARTGSTICCPKGKKSGCITLAPGKAPPANTDVYKDCANILNIGLVNVSSSLPSRLMSATTRLA